MHPVLCLEHEIRKVQAKKESVAVFVCLFFFYLEKEYDMMGEL